MHDMARPNVHLSCTQKKYVYRLVPRLFITVAAAESLIDFQLNTAFVATDEIRKSAPGLLTLGAHARGLQYLSCLSVCLCVCVCVFSLFWHLAQSGVQTAVSATSARYGHEI